MTADPRLIVPLDVPTTEEARRMVETLGDSVSFYKVGLELFATDGMSLARELKAQGKQVFLDWKLHDIGVTVQRAAAALADTGCDLLTVHGEPQVMASAVRGRGRSGLKVLAVTVLTSLSDEDLREVGYVDGARALVERRIHQAIHAGCDGVVRPEGGGTVSFTVNVASGSCPDSSAVQGVADVHIANALANAGQIFTQVAEHFEANSRISWMKGRSGGSQLQPEAEPEFPTILIDLATNLNGRSTLHPLQP